MNYSEFVASLSKPLANKSERIDHAFLGMIGELGELADAWKKHLIYEKPLDKENVKEELGDFIFYFQMLLNEYPGECLLNTNMSLGNYYKYITNLLFYTHKHITDSIADNYCSVDLEYCIISLVKSFDFTMEEVMKYNVDKLTVRYPNGYSNQSAIERLDKC